MRRHLFLLGLSHVSMPPAHEPWPRFQLLSQTRFPLQTSLVCFQLLGIWHNVSLLQFLSSDQDGSPDWLSISSLGSEMAVTMVTADDLPEVFSVFSLSPQPPSPWTTLGWEILPADFLLALAPADFKLIPFVPDTQTGSSNARPSWVISMTQHFPSWFLWVFVFVCFLTFKLIILLHVDNNTYW